MKFFAIFCLLLLFGCSDTSESNNGTQNNGVTTGVNNGSTSGGNNGATNNGMTSGGTNNGSNGTSNHSTGGTTSGGTNGTTNVAFCGNGVPCACSNGLDDDDDGLIDGMDPECTGPYDDDEATFGTGIPGDNRDPVWQDCFFDGNSGAGDDKCKYHTDCLTGDKPADDPDCTLSEACLEFCAPRAPNGCDCFGCCEVLDNGVPTFVTIGGDCSTDNLAECGTCVQNTQCVNTCGRCELCPGKTIDDLPEDCEVDGIPVNTCDDGEPSCTETSECEGDNRYCIQGCCLYVLG